MVLPRTSRSTLSQGSSTQPSIRHRDNIVSLSQPVPSTSGSNRKRQHSRETCSQEPNRVPSEEENHLAGSLIRYLFALDRGKQVISKTHIIKNVFGSQGQLFHRVLNEVKTLLSQIFGYRLVELEGGKYILVNEIENDLPHIYPSGNEGSRQVLLFLVLTHIFMRNESCTEDALWDFLTNLDISCSDGESHGYFGNIKQLVTEVFVAQKYLNKTVVEENNCAKIEFTWGPRAEHEFSRRASLEFLSQIYNGRSINSWPLQFKSLIAREKSH